MDQFLKRCFYHSGQYNSEEDFAQLNIKLKEKEVNSFTLSMLILAALFLLLESVIISVY